MRVVFMGTPDFSVPALEKLIDSDEYEVVAVYTQPDKRSGRGQVLSSSPIKHLAIENGTPVFQPETLKNTEEKERLAGLEPDVIVVVAFGQIIPQEVLDIPRFGCINIHPSLLPKYRGASPVASAILAGEEVTGVSIMLLDAGVDTGPVLACKEVPIAPDDTTESLENKLSHIGAELLMETLPKWFEQKLVPERQYNRGVIYTKQISKQDGELDWSLSVTELERKVRAFYPWPGCYTRWKGKVLRILEAVSISIKSQVEQGVVVELDSVEAPAGVAAGDGVLGLLRVQLEGKKPMASADFVRGQRGFIGQKLG